MEEKKYIITITHIFISLLFTPSCNNVNKYNEFNTRIGKGLKYTIIENATLFDTSVRNNRSFFSSINYLSGENYYCYINLIDSTIEG